MEQCPIGVHTGHWGYSFMEGYEAFRRGDPRWWQLITFTPNVKKCPVRIHTTHGRLRVPVSHIVLRGDYALHDPGRCTGPVAANAENALAAVGIADSQNRGAVRPRAVVDQVVKGPCLKTGELPTHKFPHLVAAASGGAGTAKRLPCPATSYFFTVVWLEGPRTREFNRQSTGIPG